MDILNTLLSSASVAITFLAALGVLLAKVLASRKRSAGPTRQQGLPAAVGGRRPDARTEDTRREAETSGQVVLQVFLCVLLVLAVITCVAYWPSLKQNWHDVLYAIWLFAFMVGGMFVQVLYTNQQTGRPLFSLSSADLALPLLFSVIVFYSVWTLAASAPRSMFSVYSAFLTGYFWRNIVTAAKPLKADSHSQD
jgi:hypothetical protein